MTLDFFLIIFLTRYFRKSLKDSGKLAQWDKILTGLMIISIALLVLEVIDSINSNGIKWIAHLIMLFMVYLAFWQKELRPVRTMMYAVLPFIVISFIDDLIELLSKNFYNKWENYFSNGSLFAVVWMFAMWFVVKKQRKALEKEQLKTKEKEAENSITAALKAELEVQVAERTAQLTFQKEELQNTLNELKATQSQLIQSEKMASLGELTAGIAHEIQNPLNFVNNFSEVNSELIEEMEKEINKGNMDEVKAIANDIKENEQKINHHGKRADAIVKGMLQHSRANTGKKELTDINALADEYLRLSYHGLRAKDKSFNADFKTNFDKSIGKIEVVPQDMGRVLLNLFNNAFYAVNEKKKQPPNPLKGEKYEPTVWVTTKRISSPLGAGGLEISVKDNGMGIPQKVLDKIYQPFFTTKPSGQGTGLGLSLSYDIVKKHGGELKVETKEGEFAQFLIFLPNN